MYIKPALRYIIKLQVNSVLTKKAVMIASNCVNGGITNIRLL